MAWHQDARAGSVAQDAPQRAIRRPGAVLALAYWLYVVNGIANSMIGPALLGIARSFRVDLATAGVLLAAQFGGYLIGASLSGAAADRWGFRAVLAPGALLLALGSAGTALAGNWPLAVVLTAAGGVGFGMMDSLGNAIVAEHASRAGGAALNLLHTFFGVGALAGPLLVAAFLETPAGWRGALLLGGVLALSCAALVAVVAVPPPAHLTLATQGDGGESAARSPWRHSHLWLLTVLLFLFVGVEQLGGGWSTAYLAQALGVPLVLAARSVALYWGAITVGRLVATGLALRLSNEQLLGGSLAVLLAAYAALALSPGPGPAVAALGLLGLGLAPVYPTIVAITARAYPRRFATLAGILVAAGGLGGVVFPWLGGVVGQVWGLRATMWLGVAVGGVMVALYAVLVRRPATGDEAATESRAVV